MMLLTFLGHNKSGDCYNLVGGSVTVFKVMIMNIIFDMICFLVYTDRPRVLH